MISAKEARELFDYADREAETFLNVSIEPAIMAAAMEGKSTVSILLDAQETWKRLETTPQMGRVLNKLYALGYKATVAYYGDPYVPRALEEEKDPLLVRNYGYIISW